MSESSKPTLRFCYSEALHAETLSLLAAIEKAQDPTRYHKALADLVVELTDTGLTYYFLRPLDLAKMGFVVKQTAHLGMASALKILSPTFRKIIGHMDGDQMLVVCGHIRQLMA